MKALIITGILAVLLAVVVSAHGMGRMGMGVHQEDMQKIMQEGSYQDLADLRQETGLPMMSWVTDQASFETMQQHHALMQKYRTDSGNNARMGCH